MGKTVALTQVSLPRHSYIEVAGTLHIKAAIKFGWEVSMLDFSRTNAFLVKPTGVVHLEMDAGWVTATPTNLFGVPVNEKLIFFFEEGGKMTAEENFGMSFYNSSLVQPILYNTNDYINPADFPITTSFMVSENGTGTGIGRVTLSRDGMVAPTPTTTLPVNFAGLEASLRNGTLRVD